MNTARFLACAVLAAACGSVFAQKTTTVPTDAIALDQAKAVAGGAVPGDAPGFPITISAPGSYRLTSNLVVPAGVDGIYVTASNVTIDLNGFSVLGPGECGGATGSMSCSASGTHGIVGKGQRLGVHDGTIGGFGYCAYLNMAGRIADVSLHNCANALAAFDGSTVSRVGIQRSANGGFIYASSAEAVSVHFANKGFSTSGSVLRGFALNDVFNGFSLSGKVNSALSASSINALNIGYGIVSAGGNVCNGVAC